MPAEGVKQMRHADILSFEEIAAIVATGTRFGISKVRITGGEPLVRKGVTKLVEQLSAIPGIADLSMTTNGTLLGQFAQDLVKAGLKRVNISLDTTDADVFKELTRGGELQDVLNGIQAAKDAGLWPIKVNCVIKNSRTEPNAMLVKAFCENQGLQIRYIHQMNLNHGTFSTVEGGEGGNCSICNRLRLTADGFLKPCLFNNQSYDVRKLGAEQAFTMAIQHKPAKGSSNQTNYFSNIGG
jgi:cyclic pyranopterin phosphate synthase